MDHDVLRAARTCNPPEWVVGAGVLRNLVWDHLHGFAPHWGDEPQRGREPMGFMQSSSPQRLERSHRLARWCCQARRADD
jgi:hypothetical protein